MNVQIVEGDLLEQPTEAIVNAWNQNFIPWWLLLPHGVSGAIKRKAGLRPFIEVGSHGPLALGQALATSAGRLPYKAIIHVAGINWFWTASEESIRKSVLNALELAEKLGLSSLAFPILGAGAGGFDPDKAEKIMLEAVELAGSRVDVILVRFKR
jgi:O-acetyl-ADP-ribose deacetylase